MGGSSPPDSSAASALVWWTALTRSPRASAAWCSSPPLPAPLRRAGSTPEAPARSSPGRRGPCPPLARGAEARRLVTKGPRAQLVFAESPSRQRSSPSYAATGPGSPSQRRTDWCSSVHVHRSTRGRPGRRNFHRLWAEAMWKGGPRSSSRARPRPPSHRQPPRRRHWRVDQGADGANGALDGARGDHLPARHARARRQDRSWPQRPDHGRQEGHTSSERARKGHGGGEERMTRSAVQPVPAGQAVVETRESNP